MTVTYTWAGGNGAVRLDERLVIEPDGRGSLWRTVCTGVVGDFEVQLTDPDEVASLVATALDSEPVGVPPRPGEPEEVVTVGEGEEDDDAVESIVPDRHSAGGPWGALLDRLRALRDPALHRPRATVECSGDASRLVLRHVGSEPLDLVGGTVQLFVTSVRSDMLGVGSWSGDHRVEGTPPDATGWEVTVDVPHELEVPEGGRLLASCSMRLLVGGYPKVVLVALPSG